MPKSRVRKKKGKKVKYRPKNKSNLNPVQLKNLMNLINAKGSNNDIIDLSQDFDKEEVEGQDVLEILEKAEEIKSEGEFDELEFLEKDSIEYDLSSMVEDENDYWEEDEVENDVILHKEPTDKPEERDISTD
jgi:hypothetical protein